MTAGTRVLGAAIGIALLVVPARTAGAQDPIIKPTTTTTTTTRLAAPTGITARQLADGRILVTWKPVVGAVGYSVWRSVPPNPTAVVSEGQTDTLYYDTDVKAGASHYYQIAALNSAGGVGLKAGSPSPVLATTSAASATLAIRRVFPNETGDGVWISVYYSAPLGTLLSLERAVVTSGALTWQQRLRTTRSLRAVDTLSGLGDRYTDVPAGTTLRWRVFAIDSATGAATAPAYSSDFVVPQPAASTTTSTTSTTAAAAAAATSLGNVVVSMATPVTLRVGATASLTTALGGMTARRWISLHEGIATVDAMGTATARAAGQAQVVAVGLAGDGSVRVAVVRVTVTP
jgi:hypothetical protein